MASRTNLLIETLIAVLLIKRLKAKLPKEAFNAMIAELKYEEYIPAYSAFIYAEKFDRRAWRQVMKQVRAERLEAKNQSLTSSEL